LVTALFSRKYTIDRASGDKDCILCHINHLDSCGTT